MAKMGLTRNLILSVKDYIEGQKDFDEWDSITFVKEWPEDKKMVLPADYIEGAGMVKPPAVNINFGSGSPLSIVGIGESSSFINNNISLFAYCLSEGQLIDLLDYFEDKFIFPGVIPLNDYSVTGYPTVTPVNVSDIEVIKTQRLARIDKTKINPAMRYGGVFNALLESIKVFD